MDSKLIKQGVAELFGTAVLVIGGCGTAILAGQYVGLLGISFAFGLSLLVMAYAIGNISGCHINPAVTAGMWVAGKIDSTRAVVYWIAQFIGGAIGALIIYVIANGVDGFEIGTDRGAFATNGYGDLSPGLYSLLAVIVAELIICAIFVFIVLQTTNDDFHVGFGGIAAGMALTLVHLILIPISNASVNPARSLAVALFVPEALKQVWVFILVPIAGAILAAALYVYFNSEKYMSTSEKIEEAAEETAEKAVEEAEEVEDKAEKAVEEAEDKVSDTKEKIEDK